MPPFWKTYLSEINREKRLWINEKPFIIEDVLGFALWNWRNTKSKWGTHEVMSSFGVTKIRSVEGYFCFAYENKMLNVSDYVTSFKKAMNYPLMLLKPAWGFCTVTWPLNLIVCYAARSRVLIWSPNSVPNPIISAGTLSKVTDEIGKTFGLRWCVMTSLSTAAT